MEQGIYFGSVKGVEIKELLKSFNVLKETGENQIVNCEVEKGGDSMWMLKN